MKTKFKSFPWAVCAFLLLSFSAVAQNQNNAVVTYAASNIVFPKLLSVSNTVLMTNAEFRCAAGGKVFFHNADGYRDFTAEQLSTNVLGRLGLTTAGLHDQKVALTKQDKEQVEAVLRQEKELQEAKMRQMQERQRQNAINAARLRQEQQNPLPIRHEYAPGSRESEGIGG